MRWSPAKPRTRIKVIECGAGHWDEQEHGLDIPHGIHTIDFKVTGTGHERIERAYTEGCRNNWQLVAFKGSARVGDCRLAMSARLLVRAVRHEGTGDCGRVRA